MRKKFFPQLKNKRLRQTIPVRKTRVIKGVKIPPYHYVKGGEMRRLSPTRDRLIKAKMKLEPGKSYAPYRGDWSKRERL